VDGIITGVILSMQRDTLPLSKYFQGKNLSHILSNKGLTNTQFCLVSETRRSYSLILCKLEAEMR